MIPLKLSLSNFLCYRENLPTLDFTGMRVACLCGPNGHGKSALLDAMTWALWGRARGKSSDDLIHFGQDEMWVELEFSARGSPYRVLRRRTRAGLRGRQGASDLQLQISAGNGFHPITGNTMRDTQAKIEQLIGMDYDTFINSAFLLQGRADEFTNKPPNERKEVLAKVLGLTFYDDLQERSRLQAQEKERSAKEMEGGLVFMAQEVAHKDQLQRDLVETRRGLETLTVALDSKSREVEALGLQVRALEQQDQEMQALAGRLPQTEADLHNLQQDMNARGRRVADYQALIAEEKSIAEGYQRLQDLRQQNERLVDAQQAFEALRDQAQVLEQTLAVARANLEAQARQWEERVRRELRPKAEAVPQIQSQLAEAQEGPDLLKKDEEALSAKRSRLQEMSATVGELSASQERLRVEGRELHAKLDLLSASHQDARCPLCESLLGPEGHQRLAQNYQRQIEEKRRLYQENQGALQKAQEEQKHLELQMPKDETSLRRRHQQAQTRIVGLERDLQEGQRAHQELAQLTTQLKDVEEQLAQKRYAPEERQSLKMLNERIAALNYSPSLHQELQRQVQQLRDYERRHNGLVDAQQRLPEEQQGLAQARQMSQRLGNELAQGRERLQQFKAAIQKLPEYQQKLATAQGQLQASRQSQKEMLARQGDLDGKLERIQALQREMAARERELRDLREEQATYEELTEAFGRRGVQAMLIESVLPDLESEANELLGRMTDGRMKVKLETQRELRSRRGEAAETLEIKISDELGPRSYEMFSGGEAFRINLALRIALSKVLAHRSGAPLPTLFIDEGFGTQDNAGRERLLDVIRAIEPDFERIIVITHLEELKEAFPIHIEVQKGESGSTFWIS